MVFEGFRVESLNLDASSALLRLGRSHGLDPLSRHERVRLVDAGVALGYDKALGKLVVTDVFEANLQLMA